MKRKILLWASALCVLVGAVVFALLVLGLFDGSPTSKQALFQLPLSIVAISSLWFYFLDAKRFQRALTGAGLLFIVSGGLGIVMSFVSSTEAMSESLVPNMGLLLIGIMALLSEGHSGVISKSDGSRSSAAVEPSRPHSERNIDA